jgi:U4/U6 small nuclear ribonucleoprotein PRP3
MELETRREEILLGIRPAEKGRVRLSNMMKVHGDAVIDPTEVQRRVLTEQAEREARHHARNQERKLTPEERKEKEKAKLREDTSLSSHVAVFRVLSLANGKNRFKIDQEARKNNLSGVAVYSPDFVVVAVEGGPDSIGRFTKKMLKKIPWKQPLPPTIKKLTESPESSSTTANESSETQQTFGKAIEPEENECHLVWKGEVLHRAFTDFRFTFPGKGARAYLDSLNVVHYYDSAKSYIAPLIAEPDD